MPTIAASAIVPVEVTVDGRTVAVDEVPVRTWVRHPGDLLRAVLALLAVLGSLVVLIGASNATVGLAQDLSGLFTGIARTVLIIFYSLYQLAAVVIPTLLLVWLVVRRNWRMLGIFLLTTVVANLVVWTAEGWIEGQVPEVPNLDPDLEASLYLGRIDLPYITSFAAGLTVLGPWMSRRWHRAAWLILLGVLPLRVMVGLDIPSGLLVAMSAGWLIGALALLAFGAPNRAPSGEAITRALDKSRIQLSELRRASVDARGSTPYFATDVDGGKHFIKVLGNDERSADLLFRVVRFLRLRNVGDERPFSSLRRAVEHEGMASVWAERASVRTPTTEAVVALPDGAMALVYSMEKGRSLDVVDNDELTDEFLRAMWEQVSLLRDGGVAHRDLRSANVFKTDDGQPMIIDFGFGEVSASDELLDQDVAQLILSTALDVGAPRAVAAAIAVLGNEDVARAAPRLQLPALSGATQSALRKRKGLLEEARSEVISQTGIDDIELVELQRVKPRALLTLVLAGALSWFVITQISEVPKLVGQIRDADLVDAGLAVVFSLLTYVGAAIALTASVEARLPIIRTTLVALAGSFVNRISPVKVGGIALNLRYLQKSGIETTVASASLALMALVGMLTHISLLVVFSVWSGRAVDYSTFLPRGTILFIVAGAVLGVIGVVVFTRRIRTWIAEKVRPQVSKIGLQLRDLARSPGRLVLLVGGSLLLTLSYVAALYVSILAFGGDIGLAAVAVVFLVGASLASAAPTPGGVGAVEAALIGGLTASGLPASIAVPAVFLYRLATFWIPILPGWAGFTWLQRHEEI